MGGLGTDQLKGVTNAFERHQLSQTPINHPKTTERIRSKKGRTPFLISFELHQLRHKRLLANANCQTPITHLKINTKTEKTELEKWREILEKIKKASQKLKKKVETME